MKFDKAFMIGRCQIIPIEYAIKLNGDEKQSVQPKFIEVLCYLAEHFPRVIPREELIENVWAGNHYVGEKALTNAIWHLRQILKGAQKNDEVIETIRKVGYRLLVVPTLDETSSHSHPIETQQIYNKKKYLGITFFAFFILSLSSYWLTTNASIQREITEITKYPGVELFTAPSPDGKTIVFKWLNNQDIGHLYLKDRNNPQLPPQQLTFGNISVGHSVWSNNGQYLYFSRKDLDRNTCQVIQLKVETHQENVLANCHFTGGYYYLDISPDDKILAFHGYQEPADTSGIYLLDLTDRNSQPIRFSCSNNCEYKDRDFSFSPDGKRIAVTRRVNRFNENIYLVDLNTKQAVQVTFGEEDIVGLAWHPNGEKLVYGAQRADVRRGYILDIKSKKITNLQLEGFSYPAFAKQSQELFYQQRTEKYHLASLPLNSDVASTPFPVIESKFSHHYPHYSPQSDKIAYVSNESGFYELWLSDPQGQNRQQLTFLKQTIRYPRWSHRGDKIAFLAPLENDRADKIYIYDLSTQTLSIVPSQHQTHNRPTWSWDDQAIISAVYEKEYADLHKIDIVSGESIRLSFDGSRYGIMISPTTLLYTREQKGLWQKEISNDVSENHIQPIVKISGEQFKATYSWTYSKQGIYFRQNFTKHHIIAFYDFEQQKTTPLLKIPKRLLGANTSMSIITDANELLFTLADSPQADIKKLQHPLLH